MYVPMTVPAQDPSDTEAFLESTDREVAAAHGGNIVQSRRALGLAASALGLVACAAALWSRRELHATTSADLEGLAMKTVADKCSMDGVNCETSRCCEHPESTCYKKNDHWASCNHTCSPKMKWVENAWQEQEEPVWDCGVLSSEEKKEEPVCSAIGEDCLTSKCCSAHGMTCTRNARECRGDDRMCCVDGLAK